MPLQEQFGLRVKELRKTLNLSQEKLANLANIDRTYMTSLENGKRNVSLQNIEKIIQALGITIPEFFNSPLFLNNPKSRK